MDSTAADGVVKEFFKQFPTRTYAGGQDILLASQPPQGAYFIESGHVRQYDIGAATGLEVTLHIFHPDSFFPMSWVLADLPNHYFYCALGATAVRLAPKQELVTFLKKNPDVSLHLARRLLSGLEGFNTRIKSLVLGNAYQKVCSELVYLARHFGADQGGQIIISQEFTHQNIADLTGMARETVSHILGKLHQQGIVSDQHHHLIISDLPALQQLAQV